MDPRQAHYAYVDVCCRPMLDTHRPPAMPQWTRAKGAGTAGVGWVLGAERDTTSPPLQTCHCFLRPLLPLNKAHMSATLTVLLVAKILESSVSS